MPRKSPNFKRNTTVADLIAEIRKPPIEPDTAWYDVGELEEQEIPFENGWVNDTTNPDFARAGWYTSHGGEVKLRGKVKDGVSDVIFTLPEEARPQKEVIVIVHVDDNGTFDLSGVRFRAWAEDEEEAP